VGRTLPSAYYDTVYWRMSCPNIIHIMKHALGELDAHFPKELTPCSMSSTTEIQRRLGVSLERWANTLIHRRLSISLPMVTLGRDGGGRAAGPNKCSTLGGVPLHREQARGAERTGSRISARGYLLVAGMEQEPGTKAKVRGCELGRCKSAAKTYRDSVSSSSQERFAIGRPLSDRKVECTRAVQGGSGGVNSSCLTSARTR
jgi:hypothetical protein